MRGNGTRLSLPPFPSRTVISARSKSMSFTRSYMHSVTLKPLPYIRVAHNRVTPRILEKIALTSPCDRTIGGRRLRFAGAMSWTCAIWPSQYVPVEEQNRIHRLILGRGTYLFFSRQMGEKRPNFTLSHRRRMLSLVE